MVEAKYLDKVHTVEDTLTLHTNAGKSQTNKKGYLGGTAFWLDEKGIANVVSLRTLEKNFRVSYDSEQDGGAFVCHTKNGAVVFKRCPTTGFPFVDLSKERGIAAAVLIQTVRQNFEGYTREEVERAIMARKMQSRSGHPSEATFKREVSRASTSSLFDQSPITSKDVANARQIFGPSEACIKGKWGRPEIVRPTYVPVPEELINPNRYVTLAADVMFVSGLPFLVTLSRRICNSAICARRTAGELANALKLVVGLYRRAGFICQTALMDGEFEKVKKKLINIIEVNITSKNEHVPEIERKIRHIKERVRIALHHNAWANDKKDGATRGPIHERICRQARYFRRVFTKRTYFKMAAKLEAAL
eukprot:CCRYP_016241-RA/>CCRYP_016241-RA protein AED:0.30 eAED:0.32 QI:0/0/0/1/0/0/4/0/361